ncbi:hypothetical protein SLNSH_17785 [Alsobacter soli]|uniref:Uncharacterized protein n=1 Tax=Alsobacter soli TaxID=2109933 RepID=A0A2T1HPT2_9HYPH|nr:hypothetical protein [Alsobacter soli]PSC03637.1 hypothetical protein SLNSH_17785 [Alsobacter soli]
MANSSLALSVMAHSAPAREPRKGLLASFIGHLQAVRERQAEQIISQYIQQHGGRLTDDLERQISRKFGEIAG